MKPVTFEEIDGAFYQVDSAGSGSRSKCFLYEHSLVFEIKEPRITAISSVRQDWETQGSLPVVSNGGVINGSADFSVGSPRKIGFISTAGTHLYSGQISVEIHPRGEALGSGSTLWYWRPDKDGQYSAKGAGKLHLSIYIDAARFNWLWSQTIGRRDACIVIAANARLFQWEAEHFLAEPYHRQELFIRDDGSGAPTAEISQVEFFIKDQEPEEDTPEPAYGGTAGPLTALSNATHQVPGARWIVPLLVLIFAAIILK